VTTVNGLFLGLTLKGCGRRLFVRSSLVATICEAVETSPIDRNAPPKFKHTFITLTSMPDDNFEVRERAQEILDHL
jgi:hypothetical protein